MSDSDFGGNGGGSADFTARNPVAGLFQGLTAGLNRQLQQQFLQSQSEAAAGSRENVANTQADSRVTAAQIRANEMADAATKRATTAAQRAFVQAKGSLANYDKALRAQGYDATTTSKFDREIFQGFYDQNIPAYQQKGTLPQAPEKPDDTPILEGLGGGGGATTGQGQGQEQGQQQPTQSTQPTQPNAANTSSGAPVPAAAFMPPPYADAGAGALAAMQKSAPTVGNIVQSALPADGGASGVMDAQHKAVNDAIHSALLQHSPHYAAHVQGGGQPYTVGGANKMAPEITRNLMPPQTAPIQGVNAGLNPQTVTEALQKMMPNPAQGGPIGAGPVTAAQPGQPPTMPGQQPSAQVQAPQGAAQTAPVGNVPGSGYPGDPNQGLPNDGRSPMSISKIGLQGAQAANATAGANLKDVQADRLHQLIPADVAKDWANLSKIQAETKALDYTTGTFKPAQVTHMHNMDQVATDRQKEQVRHDTILKQIADARATAAAQIHTDGFNLANARLFLSQHASDRADARLQLAQQMFPLAAVGKARGTQTEMARQALAIDAQTKKVAAQVRLANSWLQGHPSNPFNAETDPAKHLDFEATRLYNEQTLNDLTQSRPDPADPTGDRLPSVYQELQEQATKAHADARTTSELLNILSPRTYTDPTTGKVDPQMTKKMNTPSAPPRNRALPNMTGSPQGLPPPGRSLKPQGNRANETDADRLKRLQEHYGGTGPH